MASAVRERMRILTLDALKVGIHGSDNIREFVADRLKTTIDSQFTNTHAWALVDLQAAGEIVKRGPRDYALASTPDIDVEVPSPVGGTFPRWAREIVARANRRNGPSGPTFTADDLIALWNDCGGKCSVTGLDFSFELVGSSLVRRAYAPSLDRIRAGASYTRKNCRLVMVAVNFAMNAWGEDVYLRLARAAVEREPPR